MRNAVRLAIGAPVFAIQHLARSRSVTRATRLSSSPPGSLPPEIARTTGSPQQRRSDGHGPLVTRRYSVRIADGCSAGELLARLRAAPNDFVPAHVAGFVTGHERARDLDVGDEFTVEIPGPWNGPVRVDRIDENSIELVTLEGHMEAGHLRFRCRSSPDGCVDFEITSWARAGDRLFRRLHLRLRIGAELQLAMWVHTCHRAVSVAGGTRHGPIHAITEIVEDSVV